MTEQKFDEQYWQAVEEKAAEQQMLFEATTYENGYSIAELRETFEKLVPSTDWKAQVVGFCDQSSIEKVRTAVVMYTATEPSFMGIVDTGWFRVKAIGYRAGPAGDHMANLYGIRIQGTNEIKIVASNQRVAFNEALKRQEFQFSTTKSLALNISVIYYGQVVYIYRFVRTSLTAGSTEHTEYIRKVILKGRRIPDGYYAMKRDEVYREKETYQRDQDLVDALPFMTYEQIREERRDFLSI